MKQLGNPTCSAEPGRPRHLLFALKYAGITNACVTFTYMVLFAAPELELIFPPRQSGLNYSGLEERLNLQGNIKG